MSRSDLSVYRRNYNTARGVMEVFVAKQNSVIRMWVREDVLIKQVYIRKQLEKCPTKGDRFGVQNIFNRV